MPTSAPGSSRHRLLAAHARRRGRGFTLIELMIVVALVALTAGLISLALRDSSADQLDREAARLAALLETARAEARASGLTVLWLPTPESDEHQFRFVGLPAARKLPTRWLDEHVTAQVVGANNLVLGPEAILPAQRVQLRLQDQVLELATDGLRPFAPPLAASANAP